MWVYMKKNDLALRIISIIIVSLMLSLSVIFNEKEIIFPEIAALTVGIIVKDKFPWRVNRPLILVMIAIYPFLGVAIVRYVPLPLFIKVVMGFILGGVGLIVTGSTFYPLLSAIILPIILGTESMVYPISSIGFTLIILTAHVILEKLNLKASPEYVKIHPEFRMNVWIKRLLVVAVLSFTATYSGFLFLITPPLIVAFCELSDPKCKLRKSPLKVILQIVICACTGVLFRAVLTEQLGLSLIISGTLAAVTIFTIMKMMKIDFPPAGALGILPMLIPESRLINYIPEVIAGAVLFILAGIFLFRDSKIQDNKSI